MAQIVAFLNGPKGARTRSEAPEVYEHPAVGTYIMAILGGGIDVENEKIVDERVVFPKGEKEVLLKVAVGWDFVEA